MTAGAMEKYRTPHNMANVMLHQLNGRGGGKTIWRHARYSRGHMHLDGLVKVISRSGPRAHENGLAVRTPKKKVRRTMETAPRVWQDHLTW